LPATRKTGKRLIAVSAVLSNKKRKIKDKSKKIKVKMLKRISLCLCVSVVKEEFQRKIQESEWEPEIQKQE